MSQSRFRLVHHSITVIFLSHKKPQKPRIPSKSFSTKGPAIGKLKNNLIQLSSCRQIDFLSKNLIVKFSDVRHWNFQKSVVICKSTTMPLPNRYVFTTITSFQMRYCVKFYLEGYQNYQKTKSKVLKRPKFTTFFFAFFDLRTYTTFNYSKLPSKNLQKECFYLR